MKTIHILGLIVLFSKFTLGLILPKGFLSREFLPDKSYSCCKLEPYALHRDLPVIYCYKASPKVVLNTFQSVVAELDLNPDQYDLYEGADSQEVLDEFEAHRSSWSFLSLVNMRRKDIILNPFNSTCVGIRTSNDYTIRLKVTHVDYLKVALFSSGVLLFFLSPILANNQLFYYLTGISLGVMASVLILFYFLLKLLPLKKPAMFGVIAGGSTIALYMFQTFYDNFLLIAFQYQEYVLGYLLLSALISFIVCYRFGPVTNPRSRNLIKWALQTFALVTVFLSSHLQQVTLAAILILLFLYNVPILQLIVGFGRLSKKLVFSSKPKTRLLTEDEFKEQGERETKQALKELRGYCGSPECKQWQTVLRLRNPHRFAQFMEGKPHLSREELEKYEEEVKYKMDDILTDDSDSDQD